MVVTIDGQILKAGSITHTTVTLQLTINQYPEALILYVADHIDLPLVLGITWLQHYDPTIKWRNQSIAFESPQWNLTTFSLQMTLQNPPSALPEI